MADDRDLLYRDLLNRLAEDYADDPDVALATMFRSPGLRTGGKIFAFLGHDGELIVKLPHDQARRLLDEGTANPVTMGKRTMREWVAVPAQQSDTETLALWRKAAHDAYRYVDSLRRSS
ncbi:TfoX/Sxy family protein [Nonomuraea sp. NPDC050328]|uniref:TfoX/Sxy family protein n=1 Tax=Nonomuraea sp. NPDC050328 TaxID=3364361 RepID=UPI0037AD27CC